LDRVVPALALLEQGVLEGKALAGEKMGHLTVGHLSSFAPRLMPLIVASLRDTHSHMTLTLHQASLIEQLAALRSGRTHIALIHTNPDLPLAVGGLHATTIATGPRMIVMRPDNPLASGSDVVLSDAADQPFILPSGDRHAGYRASTEGACRRYGFEPRPAALANDTGVMLDMAAAGVGLSFAPWISIGSLPSGLVARPLVDEQSELVALTLPQARGDERCDRGGARCRPAARPGRRPLEPAARPMRGCYRACRNGLGHTAGRAVASAP
jgi:DNA-binding transcriptional LysR family regulator